MPSNAMMVRDGGAGAMTSPPPQPEILSVSPRPVDLLHALRRRWGWALGLGLLVTTTAVIVAMLVIPTNYTSSALLRIGAREKIMFDTPGGEGLLANRNSQAVLIKKPFVLDQALNEPGVAQLSCIRDERDKVAWLQKNLQVDFPGRNELMEIKMTGEDPAQLKRLVDAVVDAYMEKVVEVDRNAQLARKRFLQLRYEENLDDIKLKTSQVQQLSKKFHASDSDAIREKQVTVLEDFSLLKRRATAARAEVRAMDRKARLLQARLDDLPDQEEPDEDADARRKKEILAAMMEQAFAQDQWLVQSTQQAQLLGVQIEEEKLRAAREDAPSVIRLQEQLETRSEQIEKRREELGPILLPQVEDLLERKIAAGLVDTPLTVPEKISRMIDDLNLEKVLAMEDADQAKEEFDAAAEEAKKIDAYSLELETTREELDRRKKITSRMAALLEEWDVEMNALRQVTVLEPARIPKTSDVDEKTKRVAFIGLAALAVTIFGVAAVDFSSRRINSSAEVAYGLGVRVMGNTPSMTGRAWRRHGAASAFHGMLAESVDNIRTALLHSAKTEGIRAVTVTSSMEKEGKSTLASQLAASLARSGRRTLLIDGDLRRPSIHRLLEAP
ncbi:MAG: hypothetical protein HQ581_03480, partial [Planctomycetes bacterium]|nr:hypothetical protein [Planctomycetota bacterium]